MDNILFQEIARYGFNPVNPKICVGTWRNYAVALNNYAGKAYYYYVAIRIPKGSRELLKAVTEAYKAAGLNKNASVLQAGPNCIQGIFTQPKEDLGGCFTRFLDTLTGALAQNGVAPANTCAVTGAPNPDSLCFMMNGTFQGFQPVCGAAVRQSGYEAQAKVEENENNGSYLTGLIGALLGMLAGVAVNLLTIVFLQRYFAMLFALIPVAAMFGYKLFKGKLDKVSIVIVIALSVIAVPLMEYLSLVLGVSREFDIPVGIAMQATMEALQNPDVKKDIIKDILMMLLFMALGVFIAFSFLRGQLNSTKSGSSQMVLNSMRPNPLYAAPAQSYAEPEAPIAPAQSYAEPEAPIAPAAPAEPVESQE